MTRFTLPAAAAALLSVCGSASAATILNDPSLVVWLRADTLVDDGYSGALNATTEVWRDRTGPGFGFGDGIAHDASHSNGGPTLNATGGPNGTAILGFGAGGGFDFDGPIGVSGSAATTTFIVADYTGSGIGTGSTDARSFQIGNDGPGGSVIAYDLATPAFRFNNGNNQFRNDTLTGGFYAALFSMDAGDTYADGRFYLDGVEGTATNVGGGANMLNIVDSGYSIGRGTSAGGTDSNFANAQIADVLVFNRVLSDPEINQVLGYINDRYALGTAYVPEPSRALLLLLGGIGIFLRRRR